MPITISIEKKDEHGNIYYVDEAGNRMEEVDERYRYFNKEYIDYIDSLTEEDLARQRAEGAARADARIAAKKRAATPFLLKPLVAPQPAKPRLPLWGDYWHEREFCVMVGDTGVGKSLLALKVAKQIVMQNVTPPPCPLPLKGGGSESPLTGGDVGPDAYRATTEGVCVAGAKTPVEGNGDAQEIPHLVRDDKKSNKVLYVDFELDEEAFWLRYGNADGIEHVFWAGFNAEHSGLPHDVSSPTEWLLNCLENHIEETGANVLIIDQIDRVQIPIGKRMDFLFRLKAMTRKHGISTMLIINTRARNYSKEVGLQHVYHSRLYVPMADSVVAIAADYNDETCRYIKPLKLRNRPLNLRADLECYSVVFEGENGAYSEVENGVENTVSKLVLSFTAMQAEEGLLRKSKGRIREERMMQAEALRRDGMTYEYIADELMMPISTVKRWVSCVPVKVLPDGSNPLHRPKVYEHHSPPADDDTTAFEPVDEREWGMTG
jgi:hypothetical protein